jgi:diguanylate cyclase (GGDEF)-like protein
MKRRAPLVERRPTPPALAAYIGVVVVAGAGSLAWATASLPLAAGITAPGLPPLFGDDRLAGLVFWTAVGLFGSARVRGYAGRTVLTFHLPFIVAAMTLGGPVAGGWVAVISSIELRELREVPWFGTLSNHGVLALSGVVGGLAVGALQVTLGTLVEPEVATLLAAACGAFVFCALDVGMTAAVVALKERLGRDELGTVFDASFRQTIGGEVVLGWLLAVVYHSIGWWAPIVCAVLVLVVWRANDEHELTTHDALTGLLNRRGFETRLAATLRRVRRGRARAALVMIDLDGFKAINDGLGHAAGDEVLRQAGRRLRNAVRYTDVAARLGGDEFVLLLSGIPDRTAAECVVIRVHERLCEPLTLAAADEREAADVAIGASLGLVYLDSATAVDALETADKAMYEAKRAGGGVTLAELT